MVQRYGLKEDCVTYHIDLEEDTDGGWVSYEDYEDLYTVLCLLTDQVNLCELPDSLCEKLEAMGVL